MSSRPLLVVCGGEGCNDSYSLRSDNLATVGTYDGVKTVPSKNCSGTNGKFVFSVSSAANSDSKMFINHQIALNSKGECSIPKNVECIDVAGGYIAAGTSDGNLLVWRESDGELVIEQNLNLGPLTVIRIDVNFWLIYAASSTGHCGGWCLPDLYTKSEPIREWTIHNLRINDMCISTGQRIFTVGNDKTLKCFDFAAGCEIISITFENELTCICLSHNESVIYVGDVAGRIYPVQLAAETHVSEAFEGHDIAITDLAMSEDDRSLYSASLDSTIRRWDVASGSSIKNATVNGKPFALKWLPTPSKFDQPKEEEFPGLMESVSSNPTGKIVSAPAFQVPIISLDEETAIAIADICANKAK